MTPVVVSVQLATADADGISTSQTPGAAGNLTITGALASGGVATLTSAGSARQVLITCAGNETGKTFTITGTNATGNPISETVAGPNASTATTTKYFRTVTQVAISAAAAGAITVGTNGVGATRIVAPDTLQNPFNIGLGVVVSGTVNYTVQHTFDNVQSTTEPTWFSHSSLVNDTANEDGNYAYAVSGIRLRMNSGTGSATMTIIQSSERSS